MTRSDPTHDEDHDAGDPSSADPSDEPFEIGTENTGNTIEPADPPHDSGNYRDPAQGDDAGV